MLAQTLHLAFILLGLFLITNTSFWGNSAIAKEVGSCAVDPTSNLTIETKLNITGYNLTPNTSYNILASGTFSNGASNGRDLGITVFSDSSGEIHEDRYSLPNRGFIPGKYLFYLQDPRSSDTCSIGEVFFQKEGPTANTCNLTKIAADPNNPSALQGQIRPGLPVVVEANNLVVNKRYTVTLDNQDIGITINTENSSTVTTTVGLPSTLGTIGNVTFGLKNLDNQSDACSFDKKINIGLPLRGNCLASSVTSADGRSAIIQFRADYLNPNDNYEIFADSQRLDMVSQPSGGVINKDYVVSSSGKYLIKASSLDHECIVSDLLPVEIRPQPSPAPQAATPTPTPSCKYPGDPEFDSSNACSTSGGTPCDLSSNGQPGTAINAEDTGVMTAIGCVPTHPTILIQKSLRIFVGLGGGVALLLMLYATFQMITSQGNPEALKKANDQLTNAVIGLLFIIFSVLLLQIIGVDILQLPGFGKQ